MASNVCQALPDGTALGAMNASYGLLLSDHSGDTTSFMPDVPGEYKLRMTVTDGCLITAKDLPVTVDWSADCYAISASASLGLTYGPLLVAVVMLTAAGIIARRTPLHPLNPLTVRHPLHATSHQSPLPLNPTSFT
jgi:hypothetical protein